MKKNIFTFLFIVLICLMFSGCGINDSGTICFEEEKYITDVDIFERENFQKKAGCVNMNQCMEEKRTVKYETCTDYYTK